MANIELDKKVMAVCDSCGRDILDDEVALMRAGIHCSDCCMKIWNGEPEKETELCEFAARVSINSLSK